MKMREPFSRQIMTVDRSNNFVLITVAMGYRDTYSSKISMQKGDSVHTVKHRSSAFNTERIADLYQDPHVPDQRIVQHGRNVTDSTNLIRIIQQGQPDEIDNRAAQSHVQVTVETPEDIANPDGVGTLREGTSLRGPSIGLYRPPGTATARLIQQGAMTVAPRLHGRHRQAQDATLMLVLDPEGAARPVAGHLAIIEQTGCQLGRHFQRVGHALELDSLGVHDQAAPGLEMEVVDGHQGLDGDSSRSMTQKTTDGDPLLVKPVISRHLQRDGML